jgi:hypothetical protein
MVSHMHINQFSGEVGGIAARGQIYKLQKKIIYNNLLRSVNHYAKTYVHKPL